MPDNGLGGSSSACPLLVVVVGAKGAYLAIGQWGVHALGVDAELLHGVPQVQSGHAQFLGQSAGRHLIDDSATSLISVRTSRSCYRAVPSRCAQAGELKVHRARVQSWLHLDNQCRGAAKIARPRAGYFAQLSNSSLCTKGANRLVRVEVRSRNALARRVGTIRVEHRPAGQRDPCNDQTGGKPRNRVPRAEGRRDHGQ